MKQKTIGKKILIIGSSLDALEAAALLSKDGYSVTVVKNENDTFSYNTIFHSENTKAYISNLKMPEIKIQNIRNDENIDFLEDESRIKDIRGKVTDYNILLENNKTLFSKKADAIILSPQLERKKLKLKKGSSFWRISDLAKFFDTKKEEKSNPFKLNDKTASTAVFFLTRESLCRLNFALVMEYAFYCKTYLGMDVTIITPEVLIAGDELERKYRLLRENGIIFIKYSKEPKVKKASGEISITLKDSEEDSSNSIKSEVLVYSEKIFESASTQMIKDILKLRNYTNIHFLSTATHRKGIYICGGRGKENLLPIEAVDEGKECVKEINELFRNGIFEYEEGVIDVDKTKCTLCLTCVRTCPHKAIEFTGDTIEERAIQVMEEACVQCGQCVSECPTKALSFEDERYD